MRDGLLKHNDELRWERYGLKLGLNNLESTLSEVKFYIEHPKELKRKYVDVLHFAHDRLAYSSTTKRVEKFDTLSDFFAFCKSLRISLSNNLAMVKNNKKIVRDQLSKLPKKQL